MPDITYKSKFTPPSKPNALGGGHKQRPCSLEIDSFLSSSIEGGVQFALITYEHFRSISDVLIEGDDMPCGRKRKRRKIRTHKRKKARRLRRHLKKRDWG